MKTDQVPQKNSAVAGTRLLRRESLVEQVANLLTESLRRRTWVDRLPGERLLCERLQVSRTTLRAALAILQKRGLLQVVPSRHRLSDTQPAVRGGHSK